MGIDFSSFLSESTGGRPAIDHLLTIDMAKELCMIQRTERGKQLRKYFIQIEKDYNSPEKIMARALKIADSKIHMLEGQITADRPYTDFGKAIGQSDDGMLIGKFAQLLANAGLCIGQNRLFSWFRDNGYLCTRGQAWNKPKQEYLEQGLFRLKEVAVNTAQGTLTKTTTLITGKGQKYFTEKLIEASI